MIRIHNIQAYMRAQGVSWDDINQQLTQAQQQKLTENGGDFWGMTQELGFGDPQIMRDRLKIEQRMADAWGLLKKGAEVIGQAFVDTARANLSYMNRAMSGELKQEPLGNLRSIAALGLGSTVGGASTEGIINTASKVIGGIINAAGAEGVARGLNVGFSPEPEYKTKEGKPYNPNTDA